MVGSVANTIMKNTSIPTLIIPFDSTYRPIKHIVIGVDNDLTHLKRDLQPIQSIFLNPEEVSLYLVHVTQKGDLIDKYSLKPTVDLGPLQTQYKTIDLDDSIGESLMDYCEDENADLLIMIHEQRNWLQKLFRKNLSKKGLFELDLPFLVLQEQDHVY